MLGEDARIKKALGVVAALVIFFAGFKYSDYRHNRASSEQLQTEEVVVEEAGEKKVAEEEEPVPIFVHVTGAVENPGVFQMNSGDRVFQVLEKARPTPEADVNQLNLAQTLVDGGKVVVPKVGEQLSETALTASGGLGSGGGLVGDKVNINTASVNELDEHLPGIGPALAQRIVDYRERNGGFKSPEQIMEVSGIGEKRYEQIKDLITVR